MTLVRELETATALARAAGDAILEFYEAGVVAEHKIGADNFSEPVTIADKTASRIVVDGLQSVFPEDAILSEEEADEPEVRVSRSRVWMIDPIDGTQGFINKDGDFGVQIGLTENGEAILGVVYLPFHKELMFAVRGEGSYLAIGDESATRMTVSDVSEYEDVSFASSRNHRSPKLNRVMENLGLEREVRRGSVGLKVGLIAKQECDLYIHLSPRTKFWDICAPQVIIEEAGGSMTDLFGAPVRYDLHDVQNHNGIVASNGTIHQKTISRLKPLLSEFGRLKIVASNKN